MRSYWMDRVVQHTQDSYAGLGLAKFPEDLRAYEHIMWARPPAVVIELGTSFGASALWFRDRLRLLQAYGRLDSVKVISVDLDIEEPRALLADADPDFDQTITLIAGDVRDPELPDVVATHVPPGAPCLVVEDSAHVYDTTIAALQGFSRFVARGGFFVVEDGYVDLKDHRPPGAIPHGVLPAVRDWLKTREGRRFIVDRDLEMYGISSHPQGFLRRWR